MYCKVFNMDVSFFPKCISKLYNNNISRALYRCISYEKCRTQILPLSNYRFTHGYLMCFNEYM